MTRRSSSSRRPTPRWCGSRSRSAAAPRSIRPASRACTATPRCSPAAAPAAATAPSSTTCSTGFGAALDVGVSRDAVSLSGLALSRHLDAVIDLAADVLAAPRFSGDEHARLLRETPQVLDEIRDDDSALATRWFDWLCCPSHAYGRTSLGTEASLERIERSRGDRVLAPRGRRRQPGDRPGRRRRRGQRRGGSSPGSPSGCRRPARARPRSRPRPRRRPAGG